MMRTRRMTKAEGERVDIHRFPKFASRKFLSPRHSKQVSSALSLIETFHKSGSISGMKKLYYGNDALLVRCGEYIYNVSSEPSVYYQAY